MKLGQMFVRALGPTGKWGKADVLDLNEDSFKAWVVDRLWRLGMACSHSPDDVAGPEIPYRSRVPHHEY